MQNFLRCLRACWPYRNRLALSLACAVLAAVFWSVNFLAIHPALKILGGAKSLPESVQADIDIERNAQRAALDKINRLQAEWQQAGPEQRREMEASIEQQEWKVRRGDITVYRLNLLKNLYSLCLPDDRFRALVCLMVAVLVSVALRGVLEASQESLVGSITNLTIYNLRNRFFRSALRLDVNQFAT